jgi:hypothetical protein
VSLDRPAIENLSFDLDKSKPYGFRFESQEDILSFVRQGVKDSKDWLAFHDINFVKRYIEGDIYIIVEFCVSKEANNFVFASIPHRAWYPRVIQQAHRGENCYGGKHLMLISSAYPIECPEQVVPSFVWLETPRKHLNLIRELFESPSQHTIKLSDIVSKGELGFISRSNGIAKSEKGMPPKIKGRPQVVNNIGNGNPKSNGQALGQFDYMQLLDSIRIWLSNMGVWLCSNKTSDHLFEFISAFISPHDA